MSQEPSVRGGAGGAEPAPLSPAELSLEREKVQIERERLALERERWSAERDKHQTEQVLRDRAAGRVTLGISTLALALLSALLAGGSIGAWVASSRGHRSGSEMRSLLQAALATDTNAAARADSPLWRALGQPGRGGGGYLLILD